MLLYRQGQVSTWVLQTVFVWTGFQSKEVTRGTVAPRSDLQRLSTELSIQGDIRRIRLRHGSGGGTIEFSILVLDEQEAKHGHSRSPSYAD